MTYLSEDKMATGSSAYGYDCDFVDGPPEDLDWMCANCLLIVRQPYLVDCCSDHFCKACLDEILNEERKESKPTPCPLCNQELTSMPDRDLERELNQKKVCCTHKKIGCEWVGELRELDSHLNDQAKLSMSVVVSNDSVAGHQPTPSDTADPLLDGCQFVEVNCRNCLTAVQRNLMKDHLGVCPNIPMTCKHCNFTANLRELERHHRVCPKFFISCPNECGSKILQKNLAKHLKVCGLRKLECEYKYTGCTQELPRKKMESHMKSASGLAAHLSLMEKAYVI